MTRDERYMNMAIKEAEKALAAGEVAVGAIIVSKETIIGRGYNMREGNNDPTAHAEIIAIREATSVIKDWRLVDCELFCTLEPCLMCAGAILQSRLRRIVYGAFDVRSGSFGSTFDLSSYFPNPKYLEVLGGICEERCRLLLQSSLSLGR